MRRSIRLLSQAANRPPLVSSTVGSTPVLHLHLLIFQPVSPLTAAVRLASDTAASTPSASAIPSTNDVVWYAAPFTVHEGSPAQRPHPRRSLWDQPLFLSLIQLASSALAEAEAWLAKAQAGTWKAKLRDATDKLKQRIDSREDTMVRIGEFAEAVQKLREESEGTASHQAKITVHYSPTLFTDSSQLHQHLLSFSSTQEAEHARKEGLWALSIPFTALLGVLPGPNVFLAASVYRTIGHWRALHGAKGIKKVAQDAVNDKRPADVELELAVLPMADDFVQAGNATADSSKSALVRLAERVGVPSETLQKHVERWKNHGGDADFP